jgi:hypothetical protein
MIPSNSGGGMVVHVKAKRWRKWRRLLEKARVGHNVSTKNLSTVLFQPGGGVSSESRLLFSVAYFLEFTVINRTPGSDLRTEQHTTVNHVRLRESLGRFISIVVEKSDSEFDCSLS